MVTVFSFFLTHSFWFIFSHWQHFFVILYWYKPDLSYPSLEYEGNMINSEFIVVMTKKNKKTFSSFSFMFFARLFVHLFICSFLTYAFAAANRLFLCTIVYGRSIQIAYHNILHKYIKNRYFICFAISQHHFLLSTTV